MTTTTAVAAIKFTGNRAYRYEMSFFCWMPIAKAKAELMIATGKAESVTGTDAANL